MSPKDLEILHCFVEAVCGGGPFTGQWPAFVRWIEDDQGYTEAEVEAAMAALSKKIGRV